MKIGMNPVQAAIQAAKWPPGQEPGSTSRAWIAYGLPRELMPSVIPAAMKNHPIRLSGRFAATTVPIEIPTMLAMMERAFA